MTLEEYQTKNSLEFQQKPSKKPLLHRESIFEGTGGVVAIIATTAIDTRNQKAPIQVVEA